MYESFFQLQGRPFSATPQVESFVDVGPVEQARQTLVRCIERAEGPALLIGPAGTGKTLLCHWLARHFREEFKVALLTSGRLATRRALLQAILFELGLPYRDLEEGELRLSLIDHLAPGPACPQGLLLIIDEAHTLPLRLLEEIRLISNLVQQGAPRVRLVLCGGAALEERFASPKLESFHQRIAARCYLDLLSRDDTAAYVRGQIAAAGGTCGAIFTDDSLKAIHQATDGIPRLVNQVCDHALMLAFAGGRKPIDAEGIAEAWADLQQLPSPWATPKAAPAAPAPPPTIGATYHAASSPVPSGIIEFGPLDGGSIDVIAPDPIAQLDSIEYQLQQVGEPLPAPAIANDDFEPIATREPEVTIDFRAARDPFAEDFDEEEVVIDRYATLESGNFSRPYVATEEGRQLAALFPATAPAKPQLSIVREPIAPTISPEPTPIENLIEADDPDILEIEDEVDVVYPPVRATIRPRETTAAVAPQAAPILRDTPLVDDRDDSDIIIVDDGGEELETPIAPTAAAPIRTPQRQEYRNLFSRLRKE